MVITKVKTLLGLANQMDEQIEYWRDYRGEEVLIRKHSIQRHREQRETGPKKRRILQTTYIIRGEVEDVMSFPPGFRLRNVEEYLETDDYNRMFREESQQLRPVKSGTHITREIDRKFVSFDSIEELEWAKDADDDIRPLRQ